MEAEPPAVPHPQAEPGKEKAKIGAHAVRPYNQAPNPILRVLLHSNLFEKACDIVLNHIRGAKNRIIGKGVLEAH